MRRIPAEMLRRMGERLSADDRDEMAIPSYLHPNPAMRWMAWRRVEEVARRLERRLRDRHGAVAMDFGCGTGVLFDALSRRADRVYGVDLVLEPARELVAAWSLPNIELMTPEEAAERVEPGSVDLVIAAEVLEHVEPLAPTLDFFRRALARDGTLLVSLPTESRLYRLGRRLAGFHGHYHHATAADIDRAIRRGGFRRTHLRKLPAGGPFAIYWVAEYALA